MLATNVMLDHITILSVHKQAGHMVERIVCQCRICVLRVRNALFAMSLFYMVLQLWHFIPCSVCTGLWIDVNGMEMKLKAGTTSHFTLTYKQTEPNQNEIPNHNTITSMISARWQRRRRHHILQNSSRILFKCSLFRSFTAYKCMVCGAMLVESSI